MAALISWFGDRLLFRSRLNQEKMSDLAALLTEVFAGISLTRAFAAEDYEIRRFSAIAESNRLARFQTEQVKAIQDPVVGFLYAMSVLGVFWVGGWQISQGNLTGSQFLGFIAGVAMLIDPIVHITNNYSELKQGEASVERIFELLNTRSQIRELPGARPMPPFRAGWSSSKFPLPTNRISRCSRKSAFRCLPARSWPWWDPPVPANPPW